MDISSFEQWLPSLPNIGSFSNDQGSGFGRIDPDQPDRVTPFREDTLSDYRGAYEGLTTPDSYGNLRFGTNIAGVQNASGGGGGIFNRNGTDYVRSGGDWREAAASHPLYKSFYDSLDPGADRGMYDPELGYLAPKAHADALNDIYKKNLDTQDFISAMGPLAIALPIAPVAGAMAFGGAGALAEGAIGASEVAGAGGLVGGGEGAFAGGFSDLPFGQQFAQTLAPNFPGMSAAPSISGAFLSPEAFAASLNGLSLPMNLSGGAAGEGGGADFRSGTAEDLGLTQNEMNARALGTTEGAMGANPNSSFIGDLMKSFGIDFSDPMSMLRSAGSQLFSNSSGSGGGKGGFGVNNLLSLASGVYGLTQSEKQKKLAQAAAARADPFGPYRAQYAQEMSALSADPSKIFTMPGYKAGEQAVERRMAANGYLGSGNMAAALQKYGGDFFQQEMARLAGPAGANLNPGTAAQLEMQGTSNAIELASRSLASIGYGLGTKSPAATLLEQLMSARR